jgi:hypothetical protein
VAGGDGDASILPVMRKFSTTPAGASWSKVRTCPAPTVAGSSWSKVTVVCPTRISAQPGGSQFPSLSSWDHFGAPTASSGWPSRYSFISAPS